MALRIPELDEAIARYGCSMIEQPAYVIIGVYRSATAGMVRGILACAENEFYACMLRREIEKNGACEICRTEYHRSGEPEFKLHEYLLRLAAKRNYKGESK